MGNQTDRVTGDGGEITKVMRDDMRDFFDGELKNANYLLVAHGAGLVGCLSTLKDYGQNAPQLKGVGVFIGLFSAGLLMAIMATAALSISRSEMLTLITHGGEKPTGPMYGAYPLLGISTCILIVALFYVFYCFRAL